MNMQTKGIETDCGPWPGLCRLYVLNPQSSVCSYFSEVCWNMAYSHIVSTISEDKMGTTLQYCKIYCLLFL